MTKLEFYLEMLAQECAEVAQRASKFKLFGKDEKEPNQPYTNHERLIHEYNDLIAVTVELARLGITLPLDQSLIAAKKEKMLKYYAYAESLKNEPITHPMLVNQEDLDRNLNE